MFWDIAGGVAIGALLGVVNVYLLRLSVRRGLGFQRGGKAMAFIFGTYVVRYLIIALVVIALLKTHKTLMAITVLGVLAVLTVALAVLQQQYKARRAAKAGGEPESPETAIKSKS